MSDTEEKEIIVDIRNPDVVTKYRTAGDIANAALASIVALCKAGASVADICIQGDAAIIAATGKIYKGKKITKGIGFPTCVSVNHFVGHFSPEASDETKLAVGDIAKIDLGVQVDGYVAVVAHTLVVGEEGAVKATGRAGDLLAAVYTASELALRMVKVDAKNTDVTTMINAVAEDFKVSAVHGVLSHQMEQNVIAGAKCIINKTDTDEKVDEVIFEVNEVYAVDIVMSTGDGKPKEIDQKTTSVFKRQTDEKYSLKMKASRAVLSDVNKLFPTFPFNIRAMESKTARFGVKECVDHNLLAAFPVLMEKEGELVAHMKFTCLLMPNGTLKVAGPTVTPEQFETELALTSDEYKNLIKTSVGKKKKNKKKKKKVEA